ncbi:hypothetical protein ACIRU3_35695, partial [Streptomyces sp. NPDC101151]
MTRGAEAVLHAFVEGRRTALFCGAYLVCGNRDEAEDLVQTTLVKVVGEVLEARLLSKDGSILAVRDWTGSSGKGSQGPVLKTFPLTRAQLRELALKPQLRPWPLRLPPSADKGRGRWGGGHPHAPPPTFTRWGHGPGPGTHRAGGGGGGEV